MPQVGLATAAFHFRPVHAVGVIRQIDDASLADGLIEAGPAAAAFKFGIAFKQRIPANGAIIGADLLRAFEGACPGPFGAFLTGYFVYVLWQDLLGLNSLVIAHRATA